MIKKTFKSHTYQYTVNTYSFHMNKLITSTSLYQAFRNTDFTICWASISTFLQEVQGSWPQLAKNDHLQGYNISIWLEASKHIDSMKRNDEKLQVDAQGSRGNENRQVSL